MPRWISSLVGDPSDPIGRDLKDLQSEAAQNSNEEPAQRRSGGVFPKFTGNGRDRKRVAPLEQPTTVSFSPHPTTCLHSRTENSMLAFISSHRLIPDD